ncbi:MAG: hypothetical protein HY976_01900 [Candidatus Kerfeldbacteria bacterium]|nr:hypothetical protein [Candidatus Kerfeldbacteria bacterium]
MFRRAATGPQPTWKRPLYLGLTVVLGVILSYVLHSGLEIWYLSVAEGNGWTIVWTKHLGVGSCALPWWVQYGLLAVGIIGGYELGRTWWRLVYVERRWAGDK